MLTIMAVYIVNFELIWNINLVSLSFTAQKNEVFH